MPFGAVELYELVQEELEELEELVEPVEQAAEVEQGLEPFERNKTHF